MNNQREWYVAEAGEQHGPLTKEAVVALIQAGRISRRALVYSSNLSEWVLLDSIEAFRNLLPPTQQGRAMHRGLAAALGLVALVVLPSIVTKLPTISQALDAPYWTQMTLEEYVIVAIPLGFCGMLLIVALVIAARRG